MKFTKSVLLWPAVLLLVACLVHGEVATDEIRDFIAVVIKDARTDSERFTKLVEAVSLAQDNKQLRIALLEKAVGYGTKNLRTIENCNMVNDALESLGEEDVERKAHWLARKAVVLRQICVLTKSQPEKQRLAWELVDLLIKAGNSYGAEGKWINAIGAYRDAKSAAITFKLANGDKLGGFVNSAMYLYRVSKQIDLYAKKLKTAPDDHKARTSLVTATLTSMNDPAGAVGHVNDDLDERMQRLVPLAAKDTGDLSATECRNLADWYYKELATNPIPIVKRRMLVRAEQYYRRLLAQQDESDISTASVKLTITQIKLKTARLLFVDPMVCFRCGGAAKAPCSDCLIKGKPSGLHRCGACEGTGLGACSKCDGNWGSKCSRCEGTGKRTDIPEHLRGRLKGRGGIFKRISECRSCRGTGVTHGRGEDARSGVCPTCGKRRVTSERGKELCRRCKGKGGTGKCRSCQGTKTVDCTHCHPAESIAAKETEGR